jgi:hypothetical protein
MAAGVHNLTVEKGIYFDLAITLSDSAGVALDVTNYTFRAEVRRLSNTRLINSFTVTKTNATDGIIAITMAQSDTLELPAGKLQWDLIGKNGSNEVQRYLYGSVAIIDPVSNTVFV